MVFIQAAQQISIQQPLSEQWLTAPIFYQQPLVQAINPSFRDFISPNEARRMGSIMKRAIVTTLKVLSDTNITNPDAIITGTCMGCMDYTEKFLHTMVENREQTLSPTYFMQSTHNTVSSALAILTKSHGYNVTYSHGLLSFESALLDAWMQMQLGRISTALVGGYEEMVQSLYELLKKTGYIGLSGMVPCGEVSMSMMLSQHATPNSLCQIAGISVCNEPSIEELKIEIDKLLQQADMTYCDVDAVMTGINGKAAHDRYYREMTDLLFPDVPLLHYKHLFGENFTVSALGLYAAAHCLKRGSVPPFMYDDNSSNRCDSLHGMFLLNQMNGQEYSLILLKRIER